MFNKQLIFCFLALSLATPAWAVLTQEQINDWDCDNPNEPMYPKNFIWEFSDEVLAGRPFTDYENEMAFQGKIHNDLDRLLLRNDFSQRWSEWLISKNLPNNWKCDSPRDVFSFNSPVITNDPAAIVQIPEITKYVHHSIAESIPRIKNIRVHIYGEDNCGQCKVKANVYWNDILLSISPLTLKPKNTSTTKINLNMVPSATRRAKTNQLRFEWLEGNFAPKVFVEAIKPEDFFIGSDLSKPGNFYTLNPFGSRYVDIALGLACVNHDEFPKSADHITEAQAARYARIVSPDRPGATKRRTDSTKLCRKTPTPGMDCDEYPHAMFLENKGTAHVKKVPSSDNQLSGKRIGNYATPYLDSTLNNPKVPVKNQRPADNLEVIVEEPIAVGNLYCKKLFKVR